MMLFIWVCDIVSYKLLCLFAIFGPDKNHNQSSVLLVSLWRRNLPACLHENTITVSIIWCTSNRIGSSENGQTWSFHFQCTKCGIYCKRIDKFNTILSASEDYINSMDNYDFSLLTMNHQFAIFCRFSLHISCSWIVVAVNHKNKGLKIIYENQMVVEFEYIYI